MMTELSSAEIHEKKFDLTPRELEVLELVVKGCNNKEIGDQLNLTVKTVKFYLSKIYEKTDSHNRTQAINNFHAAKRLSQDLESSRIQLFDLTPRELEVIELVVKGYSYKYIAKKLFITKGTVNTHVQNVMNKLGVRDRNKIALIYHSKMSKEELQAQLDILRPNTLADPNTLEDIDTSEDTGLLKQVADLVAQALTNKEIERHLNLPENTIKDRVRRAKSVLGVTSRTGIMRSIRGELDINKLDLSSIENLRITPRELEIAVLILEGLENKEIANRLNISLGTAKIHVKNILFKLNVSRREDAAALFYSLAEEQLQSQLQEVR